MAALGSVQSLPAISQPGLLTRITAVIKLFLVLTSADPFTIFLPPGLPSAAAPLWLERDVAAAEAAVHALQMAAELAPLNEEITKLLAAKQRELDRLQQVRQGTDTMTLFLRLLPRCLPPAPWPPPMTSHHSI